MRISIIVVSSLLFLLSGCAHQASKLAPITELTLGARSSQKEQELRNLTHWKADGKLVASHDSKVIQASFSWEQAGPAYKIKFYGPLGIHAGYLSGNTQTQRVLFHDAKGRTLHASSPEKLIYDATGISFPVSHLQYWIKGLPQANRPVGSSACNRTGLLMELRQDNWDISYAHYIQHQERKGLFLPGMLKIKNKDAYLKLVIRSWVN